MTATVPERPPIAEEPRTLPAGTIGVLSGDLTRYTDFWVALHRTLKPDGTDFVSAQGADIVGNMNNMVAGMQGDWLFILGDDHVFRSDLLLRLLAHDVDVVVPLCLKRSPPYHPVVYSHQTEDGLYMAETNLPEHGLHEIWAAGTAGMLIRRHVLDAIPRPVFTTEGGVTNEDLTFCRKVRDAGYKIWVDVDATLGHISNMVVWPKYIDDSWYSVLELGNGAVVAMSLTPVLAPAAEAVAT